MLKACILIIAACALASCGQRESNSSTPAAPTNSTEQSKAAAAPAEFSTLKGKWARTDGEYVLEIRSVGADGAMEAAYFNPSPIHVSKAMAIKESSGTKVFVELRDEGYPGCTYSLNLDTSTTQLHGQYFQAAQQQTYDVVFAKLPE